MVDMSKEKFMKVYSNLIDDERNEIIVIIGNQPYTWNRAYDEINKNTELGQKIITKLVEMGLLESG